MCIMTENKNDRVVVLLDLQNTERYVKSMFSGNIRIDYEDLVTSLLNGRELVSAYIFDSCEPKDSKWNFIYKLKHSGFRADIREFNSELKEQKEVDVALATRMTAIAYSGICDVIIVVSGDRDFLPAVEEAQHMGKKVEVASFKNTISRALRTAADRFLDLDTYEVIDATMLSQAMEVEAEVFGDDEVLELGSADEDAAETGVA